MPGAGAVDSHGSTTTPPIHPDAEPAGSVNGVIHNFSPGAQATLCWTKLFGIIILFLQRRAVIHDRVTSLRLLRRYSPPLSLISGERIETMGAE